MSVRSAQLTSGQANLAGGVVIFTAPVGFRTLVKTVCVRPTGGVSRQMWIAKDSGVAQVVFVNVASQALNFPLLFTTEFVLNSGDTIVVLNGGAGGFFEYYASGALLLLP